MNQFESAKMFLLARRVEEEQRQRMNKQFPDYPQDCLDNDTKVSIRPGRKYTKVDVGTSGKFMVENTTGEIFGIKAYGVIHKGHNYGTLDTIDEWYWGNYSPTRRDSTNGPR